MDDRTTSFPLNSLISQAIGRPSILRLILVCGIVMSFGACLNAQEAKWIWSPQVDVPELGQSGSEVYYRKRFSLIKPEEAELHLAAGDEYEIYINGQIVAQGESWGSKIQVDVSEIMQPGVNTVAARIRYSQGTQPGLAVRLRVKETGEIRYRALVTDKTWRTYPNNTEAWQQPRFNDMSWLDASELSTADVLDLGAGARGAVVANEANGSGSKEANEVIVLGNKNNEFKTAKKEVKPAPKHDPRFSIDPEFQIEQILTDQEVGSVIAMEYDEFGRIYLSREGGPILIADPSLQPNDPNRVRIWCDKVSSVQGMLALNGNLYVTGQGPDGQGLYLLGEKRGRIQILDTIARFNGPVGEHGAHGLQLGPDGMLYAILGNGTSLKGRIFGSSPFKHPYEGDVVPRYEDPNGQSVGVKAPGGTIIRCTVDGKRKEIVAGGIRNAYDLVFDTNGMLFFHDSDMETDRGMPWYRPTMIFDAVAGGDYGWRSGWAKFPMHFIDQVPPVVETGSGSPTGAALYEHINFPLRYQGAMFFADWSEGRILSMRTESRGAGVVGEVKTFATGKPMNVCDLAVDPFGALCFCTGGRGTNGGVYRITWKGQVPEAMEKFDSPIARVIRQPQPKSAWGRQQIARLRREIGKDWNSSILGVVSQPKNPTDFRIRALELMMLYGPEPEADFLTTLSDDDDATFRAAVARVCGKVKNSDKLISQMLSDGDAMVRRMAAESALRQKMRPAVELLIPMLKSYDRNESLVARRLLERIPTYEWSQQVLSSKENRVVIQGATALMIADPSLANSYVVLARISKLMGSFVNDADFVDMLRVSQLAMVRGGVDPHKIPAFSMQVAAEFPSGNSLINQELVRLLACLKNANTGGRFEEYLASEQTPSQDKLHAAMMMQTIGRTLPPKTKIAIIKTLEEIKNSAGQEMDLAYLRRGIREVASTIDTNQIPTILENGAQWTDAALATLFLLPKQLDERTLSQLKSIDATVKDQKSESVEHLRTGIIAVLAQSGTEESMSYLRQMWENEPDRRSEISLGLAETPGGDNWSYLVSSIKDLDDTTGNEVLTKLASVRRRPQEASHYQDVISLGYRLRENGILQTVQLLELWTGIDKDFEGRPWKQVMWEWKKWYEETFPDGAPVITGDEVTGSDKSINEYMDELEAVVTADVGRGHAVFHGANCAKCHRCSGTGNAIGPELTNLASRFSTREIVEAIVNPDAHVADRYQASVFQLTDGREIRGMAAKDADDSLVILMANGDRIRYHADEIEDSRKIANSPMPAGSIDNLTPQQIGDLLRFMGDVPELEQIENVRRTAEAESESEAESTERR